MAENPTIDNTSPQ